MTVQPGSPGRIDSAESVVPGTTEALDAIRETLSASAEAVVLLLEASTHSANQKSVLRVPERVSSLLRCMDSLAYILTIDPPTTTAKQNLDALLGKLPSLIAGGLDFTPGPVTHTLRASRIWVDGRSHELISAFVALVNAQLKSTNAATIEISTENAQSSGVETKITLAFNGLQGTPTPRQMPDPGLEFAQRLVFSMGGMHRIAYTEKQIRHEVFLPARS